MNNGIIEGETGIRFGFGRDKKYGMWSISGSFSYSSNGLGWTAGLSWPLAGVTAASGLILATAVAMAFTGTEMLDLSRNSKTDSNDNSGNTSSKGNSSSGEKIVVSISYNMLINWKL